MFAYPKIKVPCRTHSPSSKNLNVTWIRPLNNVNKVVLKNKFYRTRRKFVGHYWYSKRVLGVRPGIHLNIYCSVSHLECFKEAYCDIEYFMTLFYSIAKTLGQNKVRTLTSSVSAFIYLSNHHVKHVYVLSSCLTFHLTEYRCESNPSIL